MRGVLLFGLLLVGGGKSLAFIDTFWPETLGSANSARNYPLNPVCPGGHLPDRQGWFPSPRELQLD
jgi:hypothetical protein